MFYHEDQRERLRKKAGALMAALKAILLWLPRERVASANGWFMMLGALGVVSATTPAEMALSHLGWCGVFGVLAAASAASAFLILVLVPERRHASDRTSAPFVGLKDIYCDPRFWRLAPLSVTCIGSSWALQGLWAGPWLVDVKGLDRAGVVVHLFIMPVGLCAFALLFGMGGDWLRKRGVPLPAIRVQGSQAGTGQRKTIASCANSAAAVAPAKVCDTRPRLHSGGWSVE